MTSYKAEVTTKGDNGKFSSNGLRFATREEASRYAQDLSLRWTAVLQWRVTETDEPATHTCDRHGRAVRTEDA